MSATATVYRTASARKGSVEVNNDVLDTRPNVFALLMGWCMDGTAGYESIPSRDAAPLQTTDLGARDYVRLGLDVIATVTFSQTAFAIIFDFNRHSPENPEPIFKLVLAALTNMVAECPLAIMAVDAFIKDFMNILSWPQRIQTRGLLGLVGDGIAWLVKFYFSIMLAIHYVAAVKDLDLGPWYIAMYTMMSLHLLNKIGDQVFLFFLRHKYLKIGALLNLGSMRYEDFQVGIARLLSRLGAKGEDTESECLKHIFFINEQEDEISPILSVYSQNLAQSSDQIQKSFDQPVRSAIFTQSQGFWLVLERIFFNIVGGCCGGFIALSLFYGRIFAAQESLPLVPHLNFCQLDPEWQMILKISSSISSAIACGAFSYHFIANYGWFRVAEIVLKPLYDALKKLGNPTQIFSELWLGKREIGLYFLKTAFVIFNCFAVFILQRLLTEGGSEPPCDADHPINDPILNGLSSWYTVLMHGVKAGVTFLSSSVLLEFMADFKEVQRYDSPARRVIRRIFCRPADPTANELTPDDIEADLRTFLCELLRLLRYIKEDATLELALNASAPKLLERFPGLPLSDLEAFLRARANLVFYFVTSSQSSSAVPAVSAVNPSSSNGGYAHPFFRLPPSQAGGNGLDVAV